MQFSHVFKNTEMASCFLFFFFYQTSTTTTTEIQTKFRSVPVDTCVPAPLTVSAFVLLGTSCLSLHFWVTRFACKPWSWYWQRSKNTVWVRIRSAFLEVNPYCNTVWKGEKSDKTSMSCGINYIIMTQKEATKSGYSFDLTLGVHSHRQMGRWAWRVPVG